MLPGDSTSVAAVWGEAGRSWDSSGLALSIGSAGDSANATDAITAAGAIDSDSSIASEGEETSDRSVQSVVGGGSGERS